MEPREFRSINGKTPCHGCCKLRGQWPLYKDANEKTFMCWHDGHYRKFQFKKGKIVYTSDVCEDFASKEERNKRHQAVAQKAQNRMQKGTQ